MNKATQQLLNHSKTMKILAVRTAKTTYPTGNPNFSVKQAFPAGFDEKESDPFLMCDYFGPTISKGKATDPDKFDVPWHPHIGMDICSYLKEGVGRHADSLGNRGEYATPGMQWISVGSGIEHAEGGGTPAGEKITGFQIWINVPSQHKYDDPQYGIVEPKDFPFLTYEDGVTARLLAGPLDDHVGPFQTKQPLQMIDFTLPPGTSRSHEVPSALDNCLAFIYSNNGGIVNNQPFPQFSVLRFDASNNTSDAFRTIILENPVSATSELTVLLFAGKRLNEPVVWHGPFVMNTDEQITKVVNDYQKGKFPPKRSSYDYKKFSTFPDSHPAKLEFPNKHSQCL
jgi:redox-sensitive bicupin YhaK (pirin superfamily)